MLNTDCGSDDELSTGVVVAISIVVTFIITLVVTALISITATNMYYKYQYGVKKEVKMYNKEVDTKQKNVYDDCTIESTLYTTPTIKMTNPTYGTSTIRMDANPAYDSSKL